MQYALALYCSDLTDSFNDSIPIGVIVVDEINKKYMFKPLEGFSGIQYADFITKAIWESFPDILEQRFEEYCQNKNDSSYKSEENKSNGFISLMIEELSPSGICFSDSMSVEVDEGIEMLTKRLFQEKVLRALD
ncbi:MAG: hypothetical protein AABX24_03810 [Nanoarchaeota archaeon]